MNLSVRNDLALIDYVGIDVQHLISYGYFLKLPLNSCLNF